MQERFAAKPDEERLAELDMLRQYLDEAKQAVDIAVASNISAVERMKKLLTAPDRKEMIREMAEVGENLDLNRVARPKRLVCSNNLIYGEGCGNDGG
jgi:hypothetical protein